MQAIDTRMSPEELKAINDAMPSEAKYGEVFKVIAEKQAEISFKAGVRKITDFAIEERRKLKEKKARHKENKPDDIQTQIILGSKMKALQQIIDKGQIKLKAWGVTPE